MERKAKKKEEREGTEEGKGKGQVHGKKSEEGKGKGQVHERTIKKRMGLESGERRRRIEEGTGRSLKGRV